MIKAELKKHFMAKGMPLELWHLASAKAERWQVQAYGNKDWQLHCDECGGIEELAKTIYMFAGECVSGRYGAFNRQYTRQGDLL